jgi:hypothetical protein
MLSFLGRGLAEATGIFGMSWTVGEEVDVVVLTTVDVAEELIVDDTDEIVEVEAVDRGGGSWRGSRDGMNVCSSDPTDR